MRPTDYDYQLLESAFTLLAEFRRRQSAACMEVMLRAEPHRYGSASFILAIGHICTDAIEKPKPKIITLQATEIK